MRVRTCNNMIYENCASLSHQHLREQLYLFEILLVSKHAHHTHLILDPFSLKHFQFSCSSLDTNILYFISILIISNLQPMSMDDSQEEEDCTVYIEELKSDNPSLKIGAASKLPVIASVLGILKLR